MKRNMNVIMTALNMVGLSLSETDQTKLTKTLERLADKGENFSLADAEEINLGTPTKTVQALALPSSQQGRHPMIKTPQKRSKRYGLKKGDNAYNKEWHWVTKAQFIVKHNGPMTTHQIAAFIVAHHEPDMTSDAVVKVIQPHMSVHYKKYFTRQKGTGKHAPYVYTVK